ncbi:MAG: gliding motility-associated C-terminal domain-containing protein [Flavobacteriales bacterium]
MRITFTLLAVLALFSAAFAQDPLPTDAGYDAWKAGSSAEMPYVPYVPAPPYPDDVQRGGGCDCWIPPDGTYTLAMNPNDDGSSAQIPLPFGFFLYGNTYNSCYINNNGNLSFGSSYGTYSAAGFPSNQYVMVAPFWADVDTRPANGGRVWYKVTPTALYVNWVAVGYYSNHTDKLNSFQVIITDGNDPVVPNGANVSFCYRDMQWTTGDASGGSNGFGGTPATVGANKGDGVNYLQFGRFDQAGTGYDGPFGASDGVDWFDFKYLSFTTDQTQANVPPVLASQSVCDSMEMCVGQMAMLDVTFLSPEPSQITTPNSTAPTLSNYTITNSTSGLTAEISTSFTPQPSDVGYHIVTFTGTDDGSPALTTTFTVVVHVEQGVEFPSGTVTTCDNGAPVALFPALGGNPGVGGTWTDPNGAAHSGTFDPTTDPVGDYTYLLNIGAGCSSYGVVTTSTVPHADAGTDGAGTYCTDGVPVDLFALIGGTPQAGGQWTDPNGDPVTATLDPTIQPSGNYQYEVTGTTPCPNDASIVAITINQAVDAGLPTSITVCTDAAPLDMYGALDGTPTPGGSWTDPSGAPMSGTFNAQTDQVGVYTYLVQTALPCLDHTNTLTISVDPAPNAGMDGSIVRCANDPAVPLFPVLGNNPDAGGIWLDPNMQPHSGVLDPPVALQGLHYYVAYGMGVCTHLIDTSTVDVTINPLPVISFFAEPDSGCHPLPVTLTNTTPLSDVGDPCVWDFGDGTTGTGCGAVDHVYAEPGLYPVRLTVTSPDGCTDELFRQAVVLVEPAPVAEFFFSPDPGTEANSTVYFTADDPHAVQFDWTVNDTHFGDARQVQHYFNNKIGDDYDVCLSVLDRYGCADTLCKVVTILVPAIFMPNAFTPDGDGHNDKFYPYVQDVVAKEHVLQVFDRWGALIFSSTDPGEGWDGRYRNAGELLPEGVYVWRLAALPTATSDKLEMFGSVTLLR